MNFNYFITAKTFEIKVRPVKDIILYLYTLKYNMKGEVREKNQRGKMKRKIKEERLRMIGKLGHDG